MGRADFNAVPKGTGHPTAGRSQTLDFVACAAQAALSQEGPGSLHASTPGLRELGSTTLILGRWHRRWPRATVCPNSQTTPAGMDLKA